MSTLKFNIDVDKLTSEMNEFKLEIEQDLKKAVANLAAMTHAKVQEDAAKKLKTSLSKFQESLGFEEIADGVWVVSVDEKGIWIEDGIEPNTDMKPGLLKHGAKTSKDGHRYKVIPFDHGKAASQLTPTSQAIVADLKRALKDKKIPFRKIERDENGSPRTGKLHSLNLGGEYPTRNSTTRSLQGVSIYQTTTKSGAVRRDVLTFRTVSDGPASDGKWIHPGVEAEHFMENALEWATAQWESQILPEIMDKYK